MGRPARLPDGTSTYTPLVRSEGQRLLLLQPGTLVAIATRAGVRSTVSIHNWRAGLKLPNDDGKRLMRDAFGIDPRAWAMLPREPGTIETGTQTSVPVAGLAQSANSRITVSEHLSVVPPPPLAPPTAEPPSAGDAPTFDPSAPTPSTLDDCLALLAVLRRDRNRADLLPSERVKLSDSEARILALRGRLEAAAELSERRYVAGHPAWGRVKRAILVALEDHPEAAKAVAAAIAKELDA